MMQYYSYFNRARMGKIDGILNDIQRLSRIELEITEQKPNCAKPRTPCSTEAAPCNASKLDTNRY